MQSMCVCACVSVRVNPKTFSTCQLVVTEGKGDLGVTSYLTDADGNVIIGCKSRPTTPTERRKSVTGKKMQKRKGEGTAVHNNVCKKILSTKIF